MNESIKYLACLKAQQLQMQVSTAIYEVGVSSYGLFSVDKFVCWINHGEEKQT